MQYLPLYPVGSKYWAILGAKKSGIVFSYLTIWLQYGTQMVDIINGSYGINDSYGRYWVCQVIVPQ